MILSWGQGEFAGDERASCEGVAPTRPRPTPILLFALAFWASVGLGSRLVVRLPDPLTVPSLAFCALACGALGVVLVVRRRCDVALLAALAMVAGSFVCIAHEGALRQDARALGSLESGRAVFVAIEDASLSDFGASGMARTTLASGREVTVRVLLDGGMRPLCGEAFEATFTVRDAGMDDGGLLWAQGAVGTVSVTDAALVEQGGVRGLLLVVRAEAIERLSAWQGAGAALLKAIVVSDREDFESARVSLPGDEGTVSAYDAVKVLGLAHLVAVSGSHLVVVVGIANAVLTSLSVPKRARACASFVLIAAYLAFSGMPVSAVRAGAMSFVAVTSTLFSRRASSLSALGACIVAMVAASPSVASSLSFQLSALATLGIVVLCSLASAWVEAAVPALPKGARESMALTLSSSLMAQPLSAAVFAQAPVAALLANLVAGPWFALLCGGGLVALVVAVVVPALSVLLSPFVWASQAFCEACALASSIPGVALPFSGDAGLCLAASCALGALLWAAWPLPTPARARRALLLAVASAVAWACLSGVAARFVPDRIVCLDVGQGDAILLQSEGASLLVDTGRSDSELLAGLAEQGVRTLDAVAVTHADDDHCGSLSALRGVVDVERVLVAQDALTCPCERCARLREDARALCGEAVVGLSRGDVVRLGAFSLSVLGPDTFVEEGGNADSLVLLAERSPDAEGAQTMRALLTGDAESGELEGLLAEESLARVDLLKVGHHGSKASITEEQARTLGAQAALVSVGADNSYGHPSDEALEALASAGTAVFRTDERGTITCAISDEGISVRCERPAAPS